MPARNATPRSRPTGSLRRRCRPQPLRDGVDEPLDPLREVDLLQQIGVGFELGGPFGRGLLSRFVCTLTSWTMRYADEADRAEEQHDDEQHRERHADMYRWKNPTAGLHERGDRHRGQHPRDDALGVERDLEHQHRDRERDDDRERGAQRHATCGRAVDEDSVCASVRAPSAIGSYDTDVPR